MQFGSLSLIPQDLMPVIQIQQCINQLKYGNMKETIDKIKNIQNKLDNYDDLVNILLDLARLKSKNMQLVAAFIQLFGEKDTGFQNSLFEAISIENGYLFRNLVRKHYFGDKNLMIKICNDRRFHYFFVDMIVTKAEFDITKDNVDEDFYEQIKKLKKCPKEQIRSVYKCGYKQDTIELYLKTDNLEKLAAMTKTPKSAKFCQFEVLKGRVAILDFAAFYGSAECFKFLLSNGHKIGQKTAAFAVYSGNPEILDLCLKDEPASIKHCFIPAIVANKNDLFEKIFKYTDAEEKFGIDWELLIKSRNYGVMWSYFMSGVDFTKIQNGNNILHLAVTTHQYCLSKILASDKALLDSENQFKRTPLSISLTKGYGNISKMLIESGSNVNVNLCSQKVVETAIKFDQVETIKYLTEKGAIISSDFICSIQNNFAHCKSMILSNPTIDFSTTSNTILHDAVLNNDFNKLQQILADKSTKIDEVNSIGLTAFHLACMTKNPNACTFLLSRGCNFKTKTIYGETTVMTCCKYPEMYDILNYMVDNGIDLNETNSTGMNALHVAAVYDRSEFIAYLILKGANKNQKDYSQRLPIDYAKSFIVKNVLSKM